MQISVKGETKSRRLKNTVESRSLLVISTDQSTRQTSLNRSQRAVQYCRSALVVDTNVRITAIMERIQLQSQLHLVRRSATLPEDFHPATLREDISLVILYLKTSFPLVGPLTVRPDEIWQVVGNFCWVFRDSYLVSKRSCRWHRSLDIRKHCV